MIITAHAYPRAALVGNPSDGYFGKTIAFVFTNFAAQVTLYHTPRLEILPNERDHSCFANLDALAEDVARHGYYGGVRLLKAAVKVFRDHCLTNSITLDERNFTIHYQSDIPHSLGLAGSSAIITACMKAMMGFFGVHITLPVLANLVLAVETEELHIPAGLQDRVAQVYGQPVFMNFDRAVMERQGYGDYTRIDARLLPPLYIAYRTDLAEESTVPHGDLRYRWRNGEPTVLAAMQEWAGLAERVYVLLREGRGAEISPLLDRNYDLRAEVYPIREANSKMVALARSAGASAKFTGSGGAIIGTYPDEASYERLRQVLQAEGIQILRPRIVTDEADDRFSRRNSQP